MYGVDKIENTVKAIGSEVIICLETAADYLGLSNGGYLENIQVYSAKPLEHQGITSIILPNCFNSKKHIIENGVACTTHEQTILDMLDHASDVDTQILLESLSTYYYTHEESFERLTKIMSQQQIDTFNIYSNDAIEYYTEE